MSQVEVIEITEPLRISVTRILQSYYPIEPKTKREYEAGKKAEEEAEKFIEYDDKQYPLEMQFPVEIEYLLNNRRVIVKAHVVLRGIIDFIKWTPPIIYEKKNYPLYNRTLRKRVQLQLSIYAWMLHKAFTIPYEDIKTYAIDENNNVIPIRKLSEGEVERRILDYIRSTLLVRMTFYV